MAVEPVRKNIAIDVDETFSPLIPKMLPWYNKKHGTSHSFKDYDSYAIEDIYGGSVQHWLDEFVNFIEEAWEEASHPFDGAVEAIQEILKHHDVFFMTARDEKVHHVTERFLKKHMGDSFTKLISLTYADKGEVLKKEKADLLIDDSLKNIKSAQKAGVDGWLFGGYAHQKDAGEDIDKVSDWHEVCSKLGLSLNLNPI